MERKSINIAKQLAIKELLEGNINSAKAHAKDALKMEVALAQIKLEHFKFMTGEVESNPNGYENRQVFDNINGIEVKA